MNVGGKINDSSRAGWCRPFEVFLSSTELGPLHHGVKSKLLGVAGSSSGEQDKQIPHLEHNPLNLYMRNVHIVSLRLT